MSYVTEEYPQSKYSFRLYDNTKRLKWKEIQKLHGPNCVAVINLGYFALAANPAKGVKYFDHQCAIKIEGEWKLQPKWHEYGVVINEDGFLSIGTEKEALYEYCIGCPPVDIKGNRYTDKNEGVNGWTYVGVKPDGTVVLLLCSKDNPESTETLEQALRDKGCIHILRYDGSWSSQGTLGPGKDVTPSEHRYCRSWLLVLRRDTAQDTPGGDRPQMQYKVCLDPGHGPGNVNGSPDGRYKEYEFAWDMYTRMKPILESAGIEVIGTKTESGYPEIVERADVSNNANADLFISIHSNAAGNSGWNSARGFMAFTSSGPESAKRNIAASAIINAVHAAGVIIFGTAAPVHNSSYGVLKRTNAPAVLLECGFHTNREDVEKLLDPVYRQTLAKAVCNGILSYFGTSQEVEPKPDTSNEPSSWAKEDWEYYTAKGVFDGTNPKAPLTREQLAVILKRLGL